MKHCFKRARYVCSIDERDGCPEFSVTILESVVDESSAPPLTLVDRSPTALWRRILDALAHVRKANNVVKIFAEYSSGEYMFGLCEPHITRLVESLPGVETLTNYAFKYGRLQLLDMPLTLNPTGCARSEPKLRTHFRKSHTLCSQIRGGAGSGGAASASTNSMADATGNTVYMDDLNDSDEHSSQNDDDYFSALAANAAETAASQPVSYMKQFSFSKSTQFKKLKAEWRQNVYLAKSKIQVRRCLCRPKLITPFHLDC